MNDLNPNQTCHEETISAARIWLSEQNPPSFHPWLCTAAWYLRKSGIPMQNAFMLMRERANSHSRDVPDEELSATLTKVYATKTLPSMAPKRTATPNSPEQAIRWLQNSSSWLNGDMEQMTQFIDPDVGANQLGVMTRQTANEFVRILFRPWMGQGKFVTVGRKLPRPANDGSSAQTDSRLDCVTLALEEACSDGWPLHEYNLIVPNLAHASSGHTQTGKTSCRALMMYPQRYYLVTESDIGPDSYLLQFQIIHYIARLLNRGPAMVCHSGNKSLHAWWRADNLKEPQIDALYRTTAPLLDTSTKGKNQLVRMPMGFRSSCERAAGMAQHVIYFNPDDVANHIWKGGS